MGVKRLFFHIGTHKTGSTSIQSVLSNNKTELAKEGIGYLGMFSDLSREIRAVDQPNPSLEERFRDELKARLQSFNGKGCHSYVISNEKFTGDKMTAYKNAGVIAKSLKKICEPFHFEIKIVVFIRRQDLFLASTYKQSIYSGSELTFKEFMDQYDETDFHWDDLLDTYAAEFGTHNLIVNVFDKKNLQDKNSLIHLFGNSVGSTYLQKFRGDTVRNKGYSRDTLEVLRHANKHLPRMERRILRDLLQEADPKAKKYPFFTMEEQKDLLSNYESSNRRVAHDYLNKADEELFTPPDYSIDEPEQLYEGLTPDSVAVVLSKAMIVMNRQLTDRIEHLEKMEQIRNRTLSDRISRKLKSLFRMVR